MKTNPTKINTNSNAKPSKPFFNKSNKGTFFTTDEENKTPFFSEVLIQRKLASGESSNKHEQETDATANEVVRQPRNPSTQSDLNPKSIDNSIVQTSRHVPLRISPSNQEMQKQTVKVVDGLRLEIEAGKDLDLLGSQGNWIKVKGSTIGIVIDRANRQSQSINTGIHEGWILKEETNLAPKKETSDENDSIAQDFEGILDESIIPTVLKLREDLMEAGTHTVIFVLGAANAWSSNQFLGAGRGDPKDFGSYASTAQQVKLLEMLLLS